MAQSAANWRTKLGDAGTGVSIPDYKKKINNNNGQKQSQIKHIILNQKKKK